MARILLLGWFVNASALTTDILTEKLEHPWSMVFLPQSDSSNEILISERGGKLRRVINGRLLEKPIAGLPTLKSHGQGGLMGLALHPGFSDNRWLYFAHLDKHTKGVALAVSRGKYRDGALDAIERIYTAEPHLCSKHHFGGRLVFAKDGSLYVTHGDRGDRHAAQSGDNPIGALLQLSASGKPLANTGEDGWLAEVFSIGHRNIQGAALHPETGELWMHEHGPRGGDEINIPESGKNYGWPVISYGREYTGLKVGKGLNEAPGLEQPVYYWTPSIAPSGMAFYNHPRFPQWQGKLFVGSLKFRLLAMLELDGEAVVSEQHLLKDELGRIRDVQPSPDGYLYLLTDAEKGKLVRLSPN